MVEQTHKRGAAEGIPLGFAIGLGMIVPRVLVGVYEVHHGAVPGPAGVSAHPAARVPLGLLQRRRATGSTARRGGTYERRARRW